MNHVLSSIAVFLMDNQENVSWGAPFKGNSLGDSLSRTGICLIIHGLQRTNGDVKKLTMSQKTSIDQLCINTIRTLAMDAVQAADSGHPGTPMAMAPVAFKDVVWLARDEVARLFMDIFSVETPWQAYIQIRMRIYDDMLTDPKVLVQNQWPHKIELLKRARQSCKKLGLATISYRSYVFHLGPNHGFTPNFLSICIQPDEGIHLRFETKVPDTLADSRSVNMSHTYREAFPDIVLPDAYERLLVDALKGDASLFARNDGIEAAWRLMDPIISEWASSKQAPPLQIYPQKSWGPEAANELLNRNGHSWRVGCCGLPCS
jgi:hypothetical protein